MRDKIVMEVYVEEDYAVKIVAEEFQGGGWRVFVDGGLL